MLRTPNIDQITEEACAHCILGDIARLKDCAAKSTDRKRLRWLDGQIDEIMDGLMDLSKGIRAKLSTRVEKGDMCSQR